MNQINLDDMEYTAPGDGLRQFDLRTGPERVHVWVAALERRVEVLEKRADALSAENEALRQRTKTRTEIDQIDRCVHWLAIDNVHLRERLRRLEVAKDGDHDG